MMIQIALKTLNDFTIDNVFWWGSALALRWIPFRDLNDPNAKHSISNDSTSNFQNPSHYDTAWTATATAR
jgi:hypothetical protein